MDGKCIDNSDGTFECNPGLLLSAGNYLIPIDGSDDEGEVLIQEPIQVVGDPLLVQCLPQNN